MRKGMSVVSLTATLGISAAIAGLTGCSSVGYYSQLASGQLQLLRARVPVAQVVADPSRIPSAIDEVLRYSGSIVAWRRKATRDAEIGGVKIPEGDGVLLVMGSANRDETMFENPADFDIARTDARNHMSFGFGIHYCLGNMLAKLQDRIVLEETIALVPSLKLTDADIDFRENISFRVPTSVPVTWEA